MDSPFDKAKKEATTFAWNLLSSASILEAKEKLEGEEDNEKLLIAFDALLDNHCKYLVSEDIH